MNPDVILVGGGIIGLSIARELRKLDTRRITVLDKGRVGGEASWAAAGMLTPNAACETFDEFHRLCSDSLALYPNFAAELLNETGVDIGLERSGSLRLAFTDAQLDEFKARVPVYIAAGSAAELLSGSEVLEREPRVSAEIRGALFFPDDSQVENRELLEALVTFARFKQVELSEGNDARRILVERGRVIGVETREGVVSTGTVVVASGAWTSSITINDRVVPFSVKPIRGQMISFRPREKTLRHLIYGPRAYIVPRADGRVLVGATVEDVGFENNVTASGIVQLNSAAIEIVPFLEGLHIQESWSGLRPFVPPDGLPVIGEMPGFDGLYVATGHFRNGILLAPITARIIADKILGIGESRYLSLFGPGAIADVTAMPGVSAA